MMMRNMSDWACGCCKRDPAEILWNIIADDDSGDHTNEGDDDDEEEFERVDVANVILPRS